MTALRPGTLCVIIAGCPNNIGLLVEVVKHLGKIDDREDAYLIKTLTGRSFNQLWINGKLSNGNSNESITDRYKLKPLPGDSKSENSTKVETKEICETI